MPRRGRQLAMMSAVRDTGADWLSARDVTVLFVLVAHADAQDEAYPSQARIARIARLSERSVWTSLRTLVEHGAVRIVELGRQRYSTRYSLDGLIDVLKLAPVATQDAPMFATGAALAEVEGRKPCESENGQARKRERPSSQTRAPRVAPVAAEGDQRREEKKGPSSVARATAPLQLEVIESKTAEPTEHQKAIGHYTEVYKRTHAGEKPEINGADGRWVKLSLKRRGLDATKAVIDGWFADPWRAERQPSLRQIDANAASAPATSKTRINVQTAAVGGVSAWEQPE